MELLLRMPIDNGVFVPMILLHAPDVDAFSFSSFCSGAFCVADTRIRHYCHLYHRRRRRMIAFDVSFSYDGDDGKNRHCRRYYSSRTKLFVSVARVALRPRAVVVAWCLLFPQQQQPLVMTWPRRDPILTFCIPDHLWSVPKCHKPCILRCVSASQGV